MLKRIQIPINIEASQQFLLINEETITPLKKVNIQEDGVKKENPKNILLFIFDNVATVKESTINRKENSALGEDN
ncbi:hypothetical protein CWI38_0148p0030 [Hamiltosporidium tvaerminnensis]|uniref:Uncharacterized protein n=1 Tax=Hamiltosporidium tvaerminnensis TaxID=1176355 RepID=A0A4Q9M081_9MICR|nr:hypothetical protein CWI38_0148p0030 [Hamiltosporidium tvaerminnensis]